MNRYFRPFAGLFYVVIVMLATSHASAQSNSSCIVMYNACITAANNERIACIHGSGFDCIETVYHTLPGWRASTQGITQLEKLPPAAREYLTFIEKETGARVGMVSTGPDREQTLMVDEFAAEMQNLTQTKTKARGET